MQEVATQSSLFINRELSWLAFNGRVLQQAVDTRTPLLERVKFLSIFSTNLDEFYMVRVAGLRRQVAANVQQAPVDGLTPQEQLDAIDGVVREQLAVQRRRQMFEHGGHVDHLPEVLAAAHLLREDLEEGEVLFDLFLRVGTLNLDHDALAAFECRRVHLPDRPRGEHPPPTAEPTSSG